LGVDHAENQSPLPADEVGSLIAAPEHQGSACQTREGQITADDLRKAEDMGDRKGRASGRPRPPEARDDGEFRRSWWHFDFLSHLTGCELYTRSGIQFAGVQTRHDAIRSSGKLDFPDDPSDVDHFKFLKSMPIGRITAR